MPIVQKRTHAAPRFRPLGLLLALLAAMLAYGLFPMLPLGMAVLISLRGHEGINADIPTAFFKFETFLALLVLVLSVLAWRGRPRWSRWALIATVWVATAYHFYQIFQAFAPPSSIQQIGGDLSDFARNVLPCEALILIAVPIYITWYMNRAPARAFYAPDK
jgi:hypothetical protein